MTVTDKRCEITMLMSILDMKFDMLGWIIHSHLKGHVYFFGMLNLAQKLTNYYHLKTNLQWDLNTRNFWIPNFLKFSFRWFSIQIVGLFAMSYVLDQPFKYWTIMCQVLGMVQQITWITITQFKIRVTIIRISTLGIEPREKFSVQKFSFAYLTTLC